MYKSIQTREKIYDRWHKELYQLDVEKNTLDLKNYHNLIKNFLGINKNTKGKMLDVACGKGLFLKELRSDNNVLELHGTDISKVAIQEAKKFVKGAEFSIADGENLPYKNNFFDFISCLGGLEYYQNSPKGAMEISRVLKRNGLSIIYVPNLMFFGYIWLALRHGMMPTHGGAGSDGTEIYNFHDERFYTYAGWRDVLQSGGLTVVNVYSYNKIGGTKFAPKIISLIYNLFFQRFIPFNLSYCFIFVCKKS